jgi:EAL domain-containing protein (putative c-di-GMP-specific phosphodiesterase class I)
MAHGLRLKVVAEGVENEGQLDFLRSLDNDEYQGFLYSKPLSAREVERRLLLDVIPETEIKA